MIRKVNKLMEGNVYFDNDDLVFTVLKKYLSPRDASWLQRNKQGLCNGDKVLVGEHILGLIAHEYAIRKFGPYVANNVGSVASYFSVMKPLTIDIKTGKVSLPQCYLAASNLSRELKKQYNQLTWQLDEVFRDIAEEILVILDEDPVDRGEEIPYEYESMRRNKGKKLRKEYIVHPSEHPVTIRPDFDNTINIFNRDEDFKNQLLGRLVSDCDYFLGNGNGFEGHLWAESVEEQIDTMRKLYHDIRPNWLSERQIDDFEDKMLQLKYSKTESIRRLGEGNSSLKLKKVKTGTYTTIDGKYEIEKSDGFWYAVDAKTGQSVVDCENSLSAIKDSLESYIKSHDKKESFRRLRESFDDIDGYAVNIHDMGKGYHHLLLFNNLDDAEYAYDQLDDISESDANEDEISFDLDAIIDTCDEVVNEIDWRREIDKNDVWTAGDDTRYQIIGNVDLWLYW